MDLFLCNQNNSKAATYPEEHEANLDCITYAVSLEFNRLGSLLAVGCNDGRIIIWDALTRSIAYIIQAHVQPVVSLSWSRNSRLLLSISTDSTACVWDIAKTIGRCLAKHFLSSPGIKVQFNPRKNECFLASLMKGACFLMDTFSTPLQSAVPLDEGEVASEAYIIASFNRTGTHIYTGNAKGRVLIFTTEKRQLVASFKVASSFIKAIEFCHRSESFLVCTADRVIRVYLVDIVKDCGFDAEIEPIQKLQDLVNKTQWKKCCYSGNGRYICGGSAKQNALYIWEQESGNLVKILHGTKGETLLDVVWHPLKAMIISISSGIISIWSRILVENWSAFAPDFKEIDENVEYSEAEGEFDIFDEDKTPERDVSRLDDVIESKYEDNSFIDIITVQPPPDFLSSDEENFDDFLAFIPLTPEIEDPEYHPNIYLLDNQNNTSISANKNKTTPFESHKRELDLDDTSSKKVEGYSHGCVKVKEANDNGVSTTSLHESEADCTTTNTNVTESVIETIHDKIETNQSPSKVSDNSSIEKSLETTPPLSSEKCQQGLPPTLSQKFTKVNVTSKPLEIRK